VGLITIKDLQKIDWKGRVRVIPLGIIQFDNGYEGIGRIVILDKNRYRLTINGEENFSEIVHGTDSLKKWLCT